MRVHAFACFTSLALVLVLPAAVNSQYQPTWDSLDSRKNPSWYNDVKFSVSLHWGVYSVPGFSAPSGLDAEWFWNYAGQDGTASTPAGAFWQKNYGKDWRYADFAKMWRAELYDASQWASLFAKSVSQPASLPYMPVSRFDLPCMNEPHFWNLCVFGSFFVVAVLLVD